MSKAVLISIKPQWCELIANGQKTVEVRKSRPKLETPFKCYIYCTSVKNMPLSEYVEIHKRTSGKIDDWHEKVIGEFICNNIECFTTDYRVDKEQTKRISEQFCLSSLELKDYEGDSHCLYGWHISDIVIYDEPKWLHHFFKPCGNCSKKGTKRCTEELSYCRSKVIMRPPQSWCYVEEREQE